jgi:serine/threonine protein kinase
MVIYFEYVRNELRFPDDKLCDMSRQIASGMGYLEEKGIIHK